VAPTRLTVVLAWAVPPVPLQLKVNVVAFDSAGVLALPAVAFVPVQPPEALHDVAFDDVQVNVLVPPLATLVGDADSVTVGAGVEADTVTDALACLLPPAPVQVRV
jgi:hypothetical protein